MRSSKMATPLRLIINGDKYWREHRFFYSLGSASAYLRTAGKGSLEWDPSDWKWDGDLFLAMPFNSNTLNYQSRQLFPLETGSPVAGASSNSSSSCSEEVTLGVGAEKGKHERELDKRRRVVVVEDDNWEDEAAATLALKLGGSGYSTSDAAREDENFARTAAKKAEFPGTNSSRSVCQVQDCGADLSKARDYHRRHKLTE